MLSLSEHRSVMEQAWGDTLQTLPPVSPMLHITEKMVTAQPAGVLSRWYLEGASQLKPDPHQRGGHRHRFLREPYRAAI